MNIPSSRASRALAGTALALALVLLYGWRLGARSLWEPDEPRYAEIAREMLVTGDWVTPRLDMLRYYEKPPLVYWSAATSFAVFGISEWSARISVVLFALLFLAGTWTLARTLFGARAAILSTLTLALAPLSWVTGRLLVTDMFLAAGVVWVLAGYVLALDRRRRGESAVLPMIVAGAGATVALLAKGPIGLLLPALGIVPLRALAGRAASIGARGWAAAWAVVAILGLPWFLMLASRDPSFAKFFLWHEHVLRFLTGSAKHGAAPWYYLEMLAGGLFPSSFLLPWAIAVCRPRWRLWRAAGLEAAEMGTWLLLLFGGGTLLFFSVSQSKRPGYILPALPVAAILVGRSLARALEERASRGLRVSMAAAALGSWAAAAATLWFSLHPPAAVAAGEASAGFRSAGILTAVLLAALGGSLAASAFAVRARALQRGLVAVAASLFLALPSLGNVAERLDASLSVKAVSLRVASLASPTDVVASFGTILQGLNFYTGRRTVIVGGAGELEFGAQGDESRGWIIEPEELPALLAERTVYLVAPAGMTSRAIEYGAGRIRVLEETPSHVLLTNAEDPPPATP